MTHPAGGKLALLAGGELPLWRRAGVALHVRRCGQCRQEVAAYRRQIALVREGAAELPPEVNWGRLASEMRANIQLGLAAGECVAPAAPGRRRLSWRVAAALASITLVILSGWWLHLPRPHVVAPAEDVIVLEATAEGIELKERDRSLTLIHSSSEPVLVSVSAGGAMAARFVDDETGMVTINNVYAQ